MATVREGSKGVLVVVDVQVGVMNARGTRSASSARWRAFADGSVQLGPINIPRAQAMAPGKVKVAVRLEAWQVLPAGQGELAGTVEKGAYLGSLREYTVATGLSVVAI